MYILFGQRKKIGQKREFARHIHVYLSIRRTPPGCGVGWSCGIEHQVFDRRDRGSKPPPPFRSLANFVYPALPVSFGRDSKSRWSLLSGVYARGSKRSHAGKWKKTCDGLTHSREGHS